MKNDARYVVTTYWGTFSLDEGSYQDYLAGKLWICWSPEKPARLPVGASPVPVTDRAIVLREQAERIGVLGTLHTLGLHEALVPYRDRMASLSIDEMSLSVRSANGLKRAGIHNFKQLKTRLESEGGLMGLRNIGQKSVREIKQLFFEACYALLTPYEKAAYWQQAIS